MWTFFLDHLDDVIWRTFEHLLLSLGATLLAAAASIPLGIAASRSATAGRIVLPVVDAVQTIPSLAMLGFLLPLPIIGGIGVTPAVVALFLYALLPIVRTTVVGLREVDLAIREAALGLGMTERQILWEVELPLAAPTILTGLRVAAVSSIGTATLAAAIGAGGLGTFVFRGVSAVDDRLVLLGAVPAALLAILVDLLLRVIERWVSGASARHPPRHEQPL